MHFQKVRISEGENQWSAEKLGQMAKLMAGLLVLDLFDKWLVVMVCLSGWGGGIHHYHRYHRHLENRTSKLYT